MKKRTVFRLVCTLVGCVVSLPVAEVLLRVSGHTPWETPAGDPADVRVLEPDPVLGWKNRPGKFTRAAYSPGGTEVTYTFLPDGSRSTSPEPVDQPVELVLLGGSYTQGQAVSDDETFAWQLQQLVPQVRVRNFGTSGYGTLQSLMRLEQLLDTGLKPKIVIYGFIEDHEQRNVASPAWLQMLALHARRGHVEVPYCTLAADGKLVRHPPAQYPAWPLRNHSALVNFLQQRSVEFRGGERLRQRTEVTQQLLLEMNQLARSQEAMFVVLFFAVSQETSRRYAQFCGRHGIVFGDYSMPLTADVTVPGDGHPNAKAHSLWARWIARDMPIPRSESAEQPEGTGQPADAGQITP